MTPPPPPRSNVIDARHVFAAARMMAEVKRAYAPSWPPAREEKR